MFLVGPNGALTGFRVCLVGALYVFGRFSVVLHGLLSMFKKCLDGFSLVF